MASSVTALSFGTFWTYVKAGLVALFGLKRAFGVTPKGVGGALPLRALKLELVDATGRLVPTSAIHIADYRSETDGGDCELDVLIADTEYWQRRSPAS